VSVFVLFVVVVWMKCWVGKITLLQSNHRRELL
jgi:hypothetical protein